nr:MAG TPA: hypothetical protein [Crassvirales sp.]
MSKTYNNSERRGFESHYLHKAILLRFKRLIQLSNTFHHLPVLSGLEQKRMAN